MGLRPWTQASISGTESWLCRKRCNWLSDRRTTLCRTLGQTQEVEHRLTLTSCPPQPPHPPKGFWLEQALKAWGCKKGIYHKHACLFEGAILPSTLPHPDRTQEADASPPSTHFSRKCCRPCRRFSMNSSELPKKEDFPGSSGTGLWGHIIEHPR